MTRLSREPAAYQHLLVLAWRCTAPTVSDNEPPAGASIHLAEHRLKPLRRRCGWLDDRGSRGANFSMASSGTTLNVRRPDVTPRTSRYGHGHTRHGWNVRVDLGPNPGMRTLRVEAVDDDGATRDIGIFVLTVERW